jgi:hypothetical protein
VVPCLDPQDDPQQFLLPAAPVLVLDAEERSRVAALVDLRFRPVDRRRVRAGVRDRLRRGILALAAAARRVVSRVRHPGTGRRLPSSALSAEERRFLQVLQTATGGGARCVLTDGAGPVRLRAGERRLPRGNTDVQAALIVVARDETWGYVAATALCEEAPPSAEAAEGWQRRV